MRKITRRIKPWYQNNLGKIYHSECTKVLRHFKNKIDLVVTSPPYDNLRAYKGFKFDFRSIARSLADSLKEGGIIVWVVADQTKNFTESGNSFKQALYFKRIGLNIHDTMIYKKSSAMPISITGRRYDPQFEYMFVFSKGRPRTFNPIEVPTKNFSFRKVKDHAKAKSPSSMDSGTMKHNNKKYQSRRYKKLGNVWIYKIGDNTKEKTAVNHPATFHEKLARDHIISWSNEDDLILDPMAGSFTTCKIAQILKRRWIGIEMAEDYCEIGKERIQSIERKNLLF